VGYEARMKSFITRWVFVMTPEPTGIFSFDGLVVDVRRQLATRNGERIDLEPKAFRVLAYLIQKRDRVVTKEELIAGIWAGAFVTDNALARVIAQIRKQLGDSVRSPRFIETVAATGYRFIAVEEVAARPVLVELPTASLRQKSLHISVPSSMWWTAAVAAACAMAIGAAAWWLGQARAGDTPHVVGMQQITSSSAADFWPSFSPDGSQIAFSSNRTGSFEIYVRSLGPGSADRQITSAGGNNIEPAWSPNGQEIGFVTRGELAVVPVSGGVTRYIVGTGADPNRSLNGRALAPTEAGSHPDWSPDGRTLVYSTGSVGKINLWLVALDGSPPRQLTRSGTPPGDHEYPKWLADGRHILFSAFFPTKGEPWVVDTMTGQLARLQIAADSVLFPSLPANARFLYFATPAMVGDVAPVDPIGVWRARMDGGWRAEKPELLIPSGGPVAHDLAVTAGASRITVSQMRREVALWTLPLNRSGLAAGEPKSLIHDASVAIREPAFSADGSRLAYVSLRQGGDWTIFVAGPDGSSPYPITAAGQSDRLISWIGSESLCYLSDRKTRKHYWIEPLHGPPKQMDLTLDLGPYSYVKASPQGSSIVAHAGNRKVGIKLVLIDLATGETRALTPPGRTFVFPSWSPDGRWISAVERIDPNTDRRVVIDVSSGAIQTLVDSPDDPAFFTSNWAPDNDRVVFASFHDGISNIYWVSRSTGQVQQVTHFDSQSDSAYQPAWSPKNDQIVFEHGTLAANIYVGELHF
jgi:Tol biopolymer transport system component/DNA-binding winged helix-turn-helix (wHTH) protein